MTMLLKAIKNHHPSRATIIRRIHPMKKITIIITIILMITSIIVNADCTICHAEEKAPQIVSFSTEASISEQSNEFMKESEDKALDTARQWILKNYRHINILSHTVTGNYTGARCASGFTTVTILYVEK